MTNDHTIDQPADHDAPGETPPAWRRYGQSVLDRRVVAGAVSWWSLWAAVALALGIVLRLIALDHYAMTPSEGRLAFQGWAVFAGEGAYGAGGVPNISPIVQLAEAFAFFIGGATDVIARLAPVAFGIATLGLVYLLRPVSRRSVIPGMLLTLGLSPTLVSFSRTVDPAIFIAFFTMLLIVCIARASVALDDARVAVWAGIAGIAIGGLIGSSPVAISVIVAAAVAIAVSAVASSNQAYPDALGAGFRRIASTPGAAVLMLGAALVTILVLFTRLFSDIDAIVGVLDTFQEWARILGTRPTTVPTQFFFWATLLYELAAVVLLLVALFGSPLDGDRPGEPVVRGSTFAIWFGAALVLQSLSSGREPDQLVLLSLPLSIAAGIGLGYVLERVERYRYLSSIASLVPIGVLALLIGIIAIFMAVARGNDTGLATREQSPAMAIVIILLLVIVPFSLLLSRASSAPGGIRRVGWAALLVLIALLGMYSVRNASMLAFERSDNGTELLAQDTSTRGVVAFVDQVRRLSRDLSVGDATLVDPTARFGLSISIDPGVADPYRWYFREFPQAKIATAAAWEGSDIVIAPDPESMAEQGYIVQSRTQFNRVPPAYDVLDAGSILSHIASPSKWYEGIRFLLFRDTVAVPPPQQVAIGYTSELNNQVNPSLGPFNLTDSPGRGAALGQFDMPTGIGVSSDGTVIYVADSNNLRVERYSADGEFIGVWNGETDPNLAFASAFNSGPTGLTVSEDDLIYVADTWNHRVVVIDRSGQFVREIGQRGGSADLADSTDPTTDTGLFFGPRGIAIHNGDIYVTDTGNERVQVFASDGTFLRTFGGYGSEPGKLIEPVGIAVDDAGRVYVADSGNARLSIFESDGTPVTQIPVPSWEGQQDRVNYLAFGPDGLLYLTSPGAGVIDVFDPGSGAVITTTRGPMDTPLQQPIGVAVMPDGELLVTDGELNDVVRFTPNLPAGPAATPAASPVASPAS